MKGLFSRPNPYDFRAPVRDESRLFGRDEELAQIRKHLSSTANGSPVHIALIGERAAGKTSLLNVIEHLAAEYKLAAARLDLDESVISDPFYFFKAMFEAVVHALVQAGALSANDPKYEAWIRQVYMADTRVTASEQLLLFGMVAASVQMGASHGDITIPMLRADAQTLASIAHQAGLNGIVVLIDEGDLIGERPALIEKLRNLFQSGLQWSLVAAGTDRMFASLSEVFSPIPRQFVRIAVGPFDSLRAVSLAVRQPLLESDLPPQMMPRTRVIEDIRHVTGGRPYEINLVCYHVWDALQAGGQRDFELSTQVLDAVVEELVEVGREMSEAEIQAIRRLDEADFEVAMRVLPYERLTVREIALSRLLPRAYEEEELRAEQTTVSKEIETLVTLGLVVREGDQFRILGGDFTRVYFKYAARRHLAFHPHRDLTYDHSFPKLVVAAFFSELRKTLDPDPALRFPVSLLGIVREMGDLRAGKAMRHFAEALKQRSVGAIVRTRLTRASLPRSFLNEAGYPLATRPMVFVGSLIEVGLYIVERTELFYSVATWDDAVLASRLQSWVEDNKDRLAQYDARVSEVLSGIVPESLIDPALRILDYPGALRGVLKDFHARHLEKCLRDLETLSQLLESAMDDGGLPPSWLTNDVIDVRNRAGFLSTLEGEPSRGEKHLLRVLELESTVPYAPDGWLHRYNLGQALAAQGRFRDAARFLGMAAAMLAEEEARSRVTGESRRRGNESRPYFMLTLVVLGQAPEENRTEYIEVARQNLAELVGVQQRFFEVTGGAASPNDFAQWAKSVRSDCPLEIDWLLANSCWALGLEDHARSFLVRFQSKVVPDETDAGGV